MSQPYDDPKAGFTLALPPIALRDLKVPTKDFLLANANTGKTPVETMKELLDRGAERAGYRESNPEPITPDPCASGPQSM